MGCFQDRTYRCGWALEEVLELRSGGGELRAWIYGTRDGEHLRGWMTTRFRQVLDERPEPWIEVAGSRAERLTTAVRRIDTLLADSPSQPPVRNTEDAKESRRDDPTRAAP